MAKRDAPREGAFPDSREVYHQLRWDPRVSPDQCEIVVVDRDDAEGTKVIPFRDFIPGGAIPWHRIVGFRYAGKLMWDRGERLDLRSELIAEVGEDRAPKAFPGERLDATALVAHRFAGGAWAPEAKAPSHAWPRRVVTWNVLFDTYDADLLDSERRWPRLLSLLRDAGADLLALTEVTPRFLEIALATDWIRAGYACSAGDAASVTPHGPLLLSREAMSSVELVELTPRRRALFARVGGALVAVVHLKSDRREPSTAARLRDLGRILDHVRALPPAEVTLLAGDFNAREGELEPQLAAAGAVDAWPAIHPEESGFTYDPRRNALAAVLTNSGRAGRLDRVIALPGAGARFTRAALLGEAEVEGSFVSDHFGLAVDVAPARDDLGGVATVHRSALAIVPPRSVWGPVQRLRARHDAERFERWMPHLNLLYGFFDAPHLPAAARALRELLPAHEPIEVVLDRVITFEHSSSTTIALAPDARSAAALIRLQRALVERFPQCTEQNRGPKGTFTPHLTLGRGNRDTATLLKREIAPALPLRWRADEIAILHRPGQVFSVHEAIPLGAKRASAETPARADDGAIARALHFVTSCVEGTGIAALVEPFGASRYAPRHAGDDLDVVVLVDTDPAGFVAALEAQLGARGAAHRRVTPAFVRAVREARHYDLHVVRVPPGQPLAPVGPWVEHVADAETRRALLGPRDAQVLRAALERHGRDEAFDALFPRVRAWSRARGLEGNAFGYFSGIGWAVLTAAPLLLDAKLCVDGSWEAWRAWAQALAPDALVSVDPAATLGGEGLRLAAPARPFRDIARAMVPSTRAVLARELAAMREGDALAELRGVVVFTGNDEASLGRYQQRFLSLLPEIEAHTRVRPVGRVERAGDGWRHVVGVDVPPARDLVARALDRLALGDVTFSVEEA
jgi:poly(A) polymerase